LVELFYQPIGLSVFIRPLHLSVLLSLFDLHTSAPGFFAKDKMGPSEFRAIICYLRTGVLLK